MSRVFRLTGILFCYFLGFLAAFILHYMIQGILIPDPCAYHDKDTSKAFDLFYKMTSDDGYHPSPTTFNYVATMAVGVFLGFFIYKIFARIPGEIKK